VRSHITRDACTLLNDEYDQWKYKITQRKKRVKCNVASTIYRNWLMGKYENREA
jgi:metal-sulfur cluster biosynthetic enzyme